MGKVQFEMICQGISQEQDLNESKKKKAPRSEVQLYIMVIYYVSFKPY